MSATNETIGEVYRVLDEGLPLIRALLVDFYGFEEREAEAFNDTLAGWLYRLAHRPGRAAPIGEFRDQLVFVACKYARAFQVAQRSAGRRFEPRVEDAFSRSYQEVAMALLGRIPAAAAS
jgi:hypothetical protein